MQVRAKKKGQRPCRPFEFIDIYCSGNLWISYVYLGDDVLAGVIHVTCERYIRNDEPEDVAGACLFRRRDNLRVSGGICGAAASCLDERSFEVPVAGTKGRFTMEVTKTADMLLGVAETSLL